MPRYHGHLSGIERGGLVFQVHKDAVIVTIQGMSHRGTLAVWSADAFETAKSLIEELHLPLSYFTNLNPWSGLFIVQNAIAAGAVADVTEIILGSHQYPVEAASIYVDDGNGGPPPFTEVSPTAGTPQGSTTMRLTSPSAHFRWTASLVGLSEFQQSKPPDEQSESTLTELVAATTLRGWRLRALNLVEEIAKDLLDHEDAEARSAAYLALAATEGLRPYIDAQLDEERQNLWRSVLGAADTLLKVSGTVKLAGELTDLARSYGIL